MKQTPANLVPGMLGDPNRVSQTLADRFPQFAKSYAAPLPQLCDELATQAARVDGNLQKLGAVWE